MSVASAVMTCVSRPDSAWTTFGRLSMASTSVPRRASSSASAEPNRPRPITTTGRFSANDRPFHGEFVAAGALAEGERGGEGERPDAPDEHQDDEQHLPGRRQFGGEARG